MPHQKQNRLKLKSKVFPCFTSEIHHVLFGTQSLTFCVRSHNLTLCFLVTQLYGVGSCRWFSHVVKTILVNDQATIMKFLCLCRGWCRLFPNEGNVLETTLYVDFYCPLNLYLHAHIFISIYRRYINNEKICVVIVFHTSKLITNFISHDSLS